MFKECSRLNFVRNIKNESHRTLVLFLKCFDVLWDENQGTSSGLTTHNWHQRSLWDSEITRTEASGMPSTGQCTTCPLSPVSLYSRFQMIIGFPVSHSEEHVSKLNKITHMFFVFVLKNHVPVTLIKSLSVRVGGTSVARLRACFLFAQGRVDRAA